MVAQLRTWIEARHAEVMHLPFSWLVLVDLLPHRENGVLWISADERVARQMARGLADGNEEAFVLHASVEGYQIMLDMQLRWIEKVLGGERAATGTSRRGGPPPADDHLQVA